VLLGDGDAQLHRRQGAPDQALPGHGSADQADVERVFPQQPQYLVVATRGFDGELEMGVLAPQRPHECHEMVRRKTRV